MNEESVRRDEDELRKSRTKVTKQKNPTITGIALSNADKGEPVTISVDMGVRDASFVIALPDEPPHVAMLRVEREQGLLGQIDSLNREVTFLEGRKQFLEQELAEARAPNYGREEFMDELSGRIVSHFFDHLKELMDRSQYDD